MTLTSLMSQRAGPLREIKIRQVGRNVVIALINKFKGLLKKFFELKMDETTFLAVLSDHITFGKDLPQPHELFLLLPGVKKLSNRHRLPLTYYDVSHTLSD